MDTNNLQNPNLNDPQTNTPSNDIDMENKYKEILEKYAAELSQQTPDTVTTPVIEPQLLTSLEPDLEPESELVSPPPEKILEPVASQLPPFNPNENLNQATPDIPDNVPHIDDSFSEPMPPTPPAPPQNNLIKVFFFISLMIFLVVAGSVAYTLYKGQSNNLDTSSNVPTEIKTSPTSAVAATFCDLNDKKYAINESFAAADGCNLCTCQPDLTIVCTEKDCSLTPSPSTKSSTLLTPTAIAEALSLKTVAPLSASNSATLTLTGTNFDKTGNNVIFAPTDIVNNPNCSYTYSDITSADGKKITLKLSSTVKIDCFTVEGIESQKPTSLIPGKYSVSVNNASGSTYTKAKLVYFTSLK